MANCDLKITEDLLFDCEYMPKGGLAGSRAVLINYDEVDRTATTSTGALIDALTLQEGLTGYKVEWYKKLGSTGSEFEASDDNIDGFKHSFLSRLAVTSLSNAERAGELKSGKFIMVVETNYKGVDNQDAFKVYGFDVGMELTEMTGNSAENAGSLLYTLTTEADEVERYPYMVLLETDYATTKAAFDALFVEV